MATPALIPADANRDNCVRIRRITRENRQLWYQLTVLQQPERARACGAGTKANSDRRPVDPPPVIELRIKEGNSFEEGKETTFDYNASFILFASLEPTRKIAQGRMQSQPNPAVLTGVPAAGMAYLDRPTAAGYFIFPDLSVRHEGQYRLSFSLIEFTKEEKDFDMEPQGDDRVAGGDYRMDIKTAPFDVYSAKKFPGLMESTPLSKEVADQGCRVRIRREVRMRKREGKSNRHERREEDFSRHRTVTPASSEDPHAAAVAAARARSISNSSEHRAPCAPYSTEAVRRSSVVEAYPPPALQPSYEHASRGHLAFGNPSAPQPAAPPRQYTHQSHQPLAPMSPARRHPVMTPHIKSEPQSYPYPPHRSVLPPCPSPSAYSNDGHVRRDSYSSYPSTPNSAHPSTNLISPHPSHPSHPSARASAPVQSQRSDLSISNLILPPIEARTEPDPVPVPVLTGGKRKHDIVFAQSAKPLHNRERQVDPHYGRYRLHSPDRTHGEFMRADGSLAQVQFNKFS